MSGQTITAALRAHWSNPLFLFVSAGAAGCLLVLLGVETSPALSLAAVLAAILLVVLIRRPILGLLLLAAVIPLERMGRFTDDATMQTISVMRGLGMLALGAILIHGLIRKRRFTFGAAFLLYAAYAALSVLSISHTGDLPGTARGTGMIVGNLLFFFVVINLVRDRTVADQAILIWLAATVVLGLYSSYDWHLGSGAHGTVISGEIDPGRGVQETENRWSTVWEDRAELESLSGKDLRRSMGPTSHAAVWGINLVLTIPFFFYLQRFRRGRIDQTLLVAGAGIVLYNVFLTNTRAAILLMVGVIALCAARRLFQAHRGHVAAGILIIATLLVAMPRDIYNRVLELSNYTTQQSASLRVRLAYWDAGVRIIGDHWLTGIGVMNERAVPEYVRVQAPDATTVHNEFLQTFMEVGVLGGAAFFGFVGLLLWYSFAAAREFRRRAGMEREYWLMVACQIGMMAVLVYGLQVDVFHFPLKGWWLLAGITVVLYGISQRLEPRSSPDTARAEVEPGR